MRDPAYRFAGWIVPGLLWFWLFFHLHDEWTLHAQYNYGWAVPFLAAFIFHLRWTDRPAPQPDAAVAAFALRSVLLVLLFPVRLIEEANPDWRLLSWTLALVVVGYSILLLWGLGGPAWTRHFAFPICFPLIAVPWPVQFENFVVQNLTRAVAHAAVEVASWIGVGAYQLGNVIALRNGFVGVNEACSGVKTLQAGMMVSLVLGELLRLAARKRIALLLAGCAWVFICNIARATVLVAIAAKQSPAALERWHDLVGWVALVLGMVGLMAIAWLLRGEERKKGFGVSRPGDRVAQETPRASAVQTCKHSLAALAWLAFVFGATELWYRIHERELVERTAWQARAPNESRPVSIPEETRAILRYNQASSAAWQNPPGVHWWSFFARWEPRRTALTLVRSHSPEICLPAVGRTFVRELPPVDFAANSVRLPFRGYEFLQEGQLLFVFVAIQDDKTSFADAALGTSDWSAWGRLRAAWRGERHLGQRLLELAVIGLADYPTARDALLQASREIVQRTTD